jgi:hypothetical protein
VGCLSEFDPGAFPGSSDTLYALSKEGGGSGGPFVAALTAHVCEAAERLAGVAEAVLALRSRGILLHCYLQSWTQAAEAWGEYGVRAMWSAATVRVLGAGVADEKFLSECSDLIGDHEEWVLQSASNGRHGERHVGSPGCSLPSAICCRISAAMRTYDRGSFVFRSTTTVPSLLTTPHPVFSLLLPESGRPGVLGRQ